MQLIKKNVTQQVNSEDWHKLNVTLAHERKRFQFYFHEIPGYDCHLIFEKLFTWPLKKLSK